MKAGAASKIVLVLLLVLVLERRRIFEDEEEDDYEHEPERTLGDPSAENSFYNSLAPPSLPLLFCLMV